MNHRDAACLFPFTLVRDRFRFHKTNPASRQKKCKDGALACVVIRGGQALLLHSRTERGRIERQRQDGGRSATGESAPLWQNATEAQTELTSVFSLDGEQIEMLAAWLYKLLQCFDNQPRLLLESGHM